MKESEFIKYKHNHEHQIDGVGISGMVERTPERRIKFKTVDKTPKATLENK